jgi:hypothetical protein
MGNHPVLYQVPGQVQDRFFHNTRRGACSPGNIANQAGGVPAAIKVMGIKPPAAPHKEKPVPVPGIKEKPPAFLPDLNITS